MLPPHTNKSKGPPDGALVVCEQVFKPDPVSRFNFRKHGH